eukprot:5077315-Karenia_brevis.AAC.1
MIRNISVARIITCGISVKPSVGMPSSPMDLCLRKRRAASSTSFAVTSGFSVSCAACHKSTLAHGYDLDPPSVPTAHPGVL